MKYTHKPTTVEAIQFQGRYQEDRELFRKLAGVRYTLAGHGNLTIHTLSGPQPVQPGDFVIFGQHDVFPCKEHVFLASYEPSIEA